MVLTTPGGSRYRRELSDLRQQLLEMGGSAEECLSAAIDVLMEGEAARLERAQALEVEINDAEKAIDERCMRLLAVHQPAASELRFVAMAMKLATDLERIGDLAMNIARRARLADGQGPYRVPAEVPRMTRVVREMIGSALDAFVELSAERREQMAAAYENQQKVINEKERTISRFMAKATKTKMAQSMQKQLDKIERIEIEDVDTATMKIRFPEAPRSGEVVAKAESLSKSYGQLKVLEKVDFQVLRGERVAFVGQNGQGKTTLAKILVGAEAATSGNAKLGHNVSIGYYAQNQAETLNPKLTLLETMELNSPEEMRTRLRSILGAFLFSGGDVDKKVAALSGGERARLALACMLLRPFNLLLLDEPTNHLDMLSKDVLKQALLAYKGTLLVVSHDREFLTDLSSRTIEFRDGHLYEYLGDVNYFLDKRKVDNMREVEMRSKANVGQKAPDTSVKALGSEEKKQLERAVQKAEKKIADLETEVKKYEEKMGDPDFYNRPEANDELKKYQDLKDSLAIVYTEWEETVERLG